MLDLLELLFTSPSSVDKYSERLAAEVEKIVASRTSEPHHRVDILLGLGFSFLSVRDSKGETIYMEYFSMERVPITEFDPDALGKHSQFQVISNPEGVMVIDLRGRREDESAFYRHKGLATYKSIIPLRETLQDLTSEMHCGVRNPQWIVNTLMISGYRRGEGFKEAEVRVLDDGTAAVSFYFDGSPNLHYTLSRKDPAMKKVPCWEEKNNVKFTITVSGEKNFSIRFPK